VQDGPDETAGDVDKNEDCDKDDGQLTSSPCFISEHLTLALASPLQIHTYIQTLDNAHCSQAQGLNLRRGRSLGGKTTVDVNDEQTRWVIKRDLNELKVWRDDGQLTGVGGDVTQGVDERRHGAKHVLTMTAKVVPTPRHKCKKRSNKNKKRQKCKKNVIFFKKTFANVIKKVTSS